MTLKTPHADPEVADRAAIFDAMKAIARRETLPHFRADLQVDNKLADKGGYDPVTVADRNCEAALRALIGEHFPQDGIFGEEYGASQLDARFVWVIDPVDGTRAFVAGVPLWGMLVGLMDDGKPVAGLAHQPFIDEAFSTAGDAGAALWTKGNAEAGAQPQSRAINSRPCPQLSAATLMTTTPALFNDSERDAYDVLEKKVRAVRYGGDWYGYALVAAGTCDIVVESGLSAYDILPLVPIIEAAGGRVTDWQGNPLPPPDASFPKQVLAVGDAGLLGPACKLLEPAAR